MSAVPPQKTEQNPVGVAASAGYGSDYQAEATGAKEAAPLRTPLLVKERLQFIGFRTICAAVCVVAVLALAVAFCLTLINPNPDEACDGKWGEWGACSGGQNRRNCTRSRSFVPASDSCRELRALHGETPEAETQVCSDDQACGQPVPESVPEPDRTVVGLPEPEPTPAPEPAPSNADGSWSATLGGMNGVPTRDYRFRTTNLTDIPRTAKYGTLMRTECNKLGMMPVCDHKDYADSVSLYLGQDGNLANPQVDTPSKLSICP